MNKKIKSFINNCSLLIICFLFLLPYIVMIIATFSTSSAIKGNNIFNNLSLSNFIVNATALFNERFFLSSILNSSFISFFAGLISVIVASMAGYAYTLYKNKTMDRLFLYSFIAMMIPGIITIIPIFLIFVTVGLIDTYFAVIISTISLPFNIFLFKQNTRLMPVELIKAARIDGLSEINIFFKVYLPCMKSVFITSFLLSFLSAWNTLLLPLVLLQSQRKFTNLIFLNSLGSVWTSDYAVLMLAIFLSTLPVIIMFLFFQKYIKNTIKGIN